MQLSICVIDHQTLLIVANYLIDEVIKELPEGDPNLERLQKVKDIVNTKAYSQSPASTKFHNYFKGGLLFHSLKVTLLMMEYRDLLQLPIHDVSILICGLLHDLTKIDEYLYDNRSKSYIRNNNSSYRNLIHADKSLQLIADKDIWLTEDEKLAIKYHMGPFGVDAKELYNSFSKFHLVFIMHIADVTDAKNIDEGRCLMNYIKSRKIL